MNWKEQYDLNVKILDSLSFPDPDPCEDVGVYMDRIQEQFKDIQLPPEMEGELFNSIGIEEFCDYLREHRGYYISEEIRYRVWPK